MEFEEHEEHEEEMDLGASYDSLANSAARVKISSETGPEGMMNQSTSQTQQHLKKPRYRECLKNHAVGLGGHALDGCGEFMPAGAEGTIDALQCAACNCHRNFHRKETEPVTSGHGPVSIGEQYGVVPSHQYQYQPHPHPHSHPQFSSPYYRTPAGYLHVAQQHRPLALPSTSGGGGSHSREDQEDVSNPHGGVGGGGSGFVGSSKKRFRTKFTQEQKDGMLSLAEKLGWRIQKENEAEVQQFCNETGVKRQVLKVWMHNNKHTLGQKP